MLKILNTSSKFKRNCNYHLRAHLSFCFYSDKYDNQKSSLISDDIMKTSLYDFHLNHNAKMIEFGGFYMPVLYGKDSINSSHNHTRKCCSLFDVSHMLQFSVYGSNRIRFLESISVGDIRTLKENHSLLSLMTNNRGGIIDDFIVTKLPESLYVVSNASTKLKVLDLLNTNIKNNNFKEISINILSTYSLIALQGPQSMTVLQPLTNINLQELQFMSSSAAEICGFSNCRITRCGYTGEDGFEISVPNTYVVSICEQLLQSDCGNVKLAGLGARDSLRLEAGLCLSGVDIDEDTTPIEAGLQWCVAKRRRVEKDFPGAETILSQLKHGPRKIRVGLISKGISPRKGTKILSVNRKEIGIVTSGCPSPSLNYNIAMGYIPPYETKTNQQFILANKQSYITATITKLPFLTPKYYKRN